MLRICFENYRGAFGTRHKSPPNWQSLIVEDQEGTRPKNLRSISPSSKKSSKMFARQRAKSKGQRAKGKGPRAKGEEQRAKSKGRRAKGEEQRAKSKGRRAKGEEQRAESHSYWDCESYSDNLLV